MRILFTSVPLSGHFFPLVPLAWACRSAGHDVKVAVPGNFVSAVLQAGLPAVSCGPPANIVGQVGSADGEFEWQRRYQHGQLFGQIAAGSLAGMRSLINSWRPDLLVSERAEFAGPIAAATRDIPHVELHWGVAELEEYRWGARDVLDGALAKLGLDALPEPRQTINPWPSSLRPPYATGHQSIRHVPYDADARVPRWVLEPRTRTRICVTQGTVVPRRGHGGLSADLVSMVGALAELDFELVVAVEDRVAAASPPLPDLVRHVGWIPLSQVLRVSDVLIHHGGQGTSLSALEAGVPQLIMPQFDDQLENAGAVVKAGAGIRLSPNQVNTKVAVKCCLDLLDKVEFGRAASRISTEIADQPLPIDVMRALEELVT